MKSLVTMIRSFSIQDLTLIVQLHIIKSLHRICQKSCQKAYDKHGVHQDFLNAEYHKTMIRLLNKKGSFLTNDEKVYVIKRIAKEHCYEI